MNGRRILLAGCGDIGTGLGERLLARGAEVWGLKRNPEGLPAGFQGIAGDYTDPASLAGLGGRKFDHVVVTLTPSAHTDEAYEAAYVRGLHNVLGALDPDPGFAAKGAALVRGRPEERVPKLAQAERDALAAACRPGAQLLGRAL